MSNKVSAQAVNVMGGLIKLLTYHMEAAISTSHFSCIAFSFIFTPFPSSRMKVFIHLDECPLSTPALETSFTLYSLVVSRSFGSYVCWFEGCSLSYFLN